jgi:hypothetical protein
MRTPEGAARPARLALMPKHEIALELPQQFFLASKDMVIAVRSDGGLLGRVKISKGSIDWMPAGNSRYSHKMSWEKFRDVMEGTRPQKG